MQLFLLPSNIMDRKCQSVDYVSMNLFHLTITIHFASKYCNHIPPTCHWTPVPVGPSSTGKTIYAAKTFHQHKRLLLGVGMMSSQLWLERRLRWMLRSRSCDSSIATQLRVGWEYIQNNKHACTAKGIVERVKLFDEEKSHCFQVRGKTMCHYYIRLTYILSMKYSHQQHAIVCINLLLCPCCVHGCDGRFLPTIGSTCSSSRSCVGGTICRFDTFLLGGSSSSSSSCLHQQAWNFS